MSGANANTVFSIQAVVQEFDSLKTMISVLQQVGERTFQRADTLQATITDQIRPSIEHLIHRISSLEEVISCESSVNPCAQTATHDHQSQSHSAMRPSQKVSEPPPQQPLQWIP
eukprot:6191471-Prorocentrum_lima.AAC.1